MDKGVGAPLSMEEMIKTDKILNDMRAKRKKVHPLKQPYRESPFGDPICRFHNYDSGGCMKGAACPFDHSHCHICVAPGHAALSCPRFKDEAEFKKFREAFTLLSTRPSSYRKRTVLGDAIKWDTERLPPACRQDDGQLRRCRRHKRFEAELLGALEVGSSFVDVGAHFGDTTATMAAHAKAVGRTDVRFFAFEPSKLKCLWLEEVAEANGLNIVVVNAAVGERERVVRPERGGKKRALFDGSMKYEEVAEGESSSGSGGGSSDSEEDEGGDEGVVRMVSLDSMVDEISPLGLLHLDVEGWEAQALRGGREVLARSAGTCHVIAEVWEDKDCFRRGVEGGAEEKIEAVMRDHALFKRGDDIKDRERNVVYSKTTA